MFKKYFLFSKKILLKKILPLFKKQKINLPKLSPREKILSLVKNNEGNFVDIKESLISKGMNSLSFNAVHLNHKVNIGENFIFQDLKIHISGKNNTILIGNNVRIKGRIRLSGNNITLKIGDNTTIQGASILASEANVTIGNNCMFSREIEIRSTDAHKIYVKGEKVPINTPKPVIIGDNVWLGARAFISKGAVIPNGCIIGAMSFVSKSLEKENTIYAGIPVKEIRTDISWKR